MQLVPDSTRANTKNENIGSRTKLHMNRPCDIAWAPIPKRNRTIRKTESTALAYHIGRSLCEPIHTHTGRQGISGRENSTKNSTRNEYKVKTAKMRHRRSHTRTHPSSHSCIWTTMVDDCALRPWARNRVETKYVTTGEEKKFASEQIKIQN